MGNSCDGIHKFVHEWNKLLQNAKFRLSKEGEVNDEPVSKIIPNSIRLLR